MRCGRRSASAAAGAGAGGEGCSAATRAAGITHGRAGALATAGAPGPGATGPGTTAATLTATALATSATLTTATLATSATLTTATLTTATLAAALATAVALAVLLPTGRDRRDVRAGIHPLTRRKIGQQRVRRVDPGRGRLDACLAGQVATSRTWSSVISVMTVPELPARAVRPERCR